MEHLHSFKDWSLFPKQIMYESVSTWKIIGSQNGQYNYWFVLGDGWEETVLSEK
jgi:hypothetical protein